MKKLFVISSAMLIFIACSHKVVSTTNTSSTTDKGKADANAMYIAEIKPMLEIKCEPCHFPAKGGFKAALDNYTAVSDHIDDMLKRVQLKPSEPGYMPFKSKRDPLTEAEIASLKAFKAALGK